jgi:hypothetical protein
MNMRGHRRHQLYKTRHSFPFRTLGVERWAGLKRLNRYHAQPLFNNHEVRK